MQQNTCKNEISKNLKNMYFKTKNKPNQISKNVYNENSQFLKQ